MTTITDKKQYPGEQYLNELITNIEFAARAPVEVVRAMAAELQERRKADSVSVEINDDMAYAFHHALSDSSLGADEVEEIKAGLRAAFANVTTQPAPVVPEFETWFNSQESGRSICSTQIRRSLQEISWNACCAAMLQCAEPASNHEELPLDYLQGQKDGLEWAAQLAEANHPQTGDWLYDDPVELAKAIRKGPDMPEAAGNSPVITDGWISCSERMPEDTKMLLAFSQGEIVAAYWNWVVNPVDYKKYRAFTYLSGNILDDVTHWMPLPEPPQEVNP
ncbi:DUF551 domain-containing protein [Escherichia coli]|uniref:DUF551 domain-containing protein n=1 Tax=Escherichia coli TaxID=562 RepID=UPI000973FB01|nr:DUF551 domain-containing protein [Escherichia coli]TII41729.1 DUF551 domain-containing protein [Escherichia coli]TIJ10630.1 DUF551 domain-containing protein [Escherichia coli]SJK87500.1 hypothetical protein RCEC007_200028 [Escherichia coli]HAW6936934.1 DUF551 domain-containing protein [Escherichia coli]